MSQIETSIVIPIKDEEANIPLLYDELKEVLRDRSHEIILINDGSTDRTGDVLADLASKDNTIRIINFAKNYGQTAAMAAGFSASRGDVVICMDGDRQNDPHDINKLLEKMDEGYDIISGWRKDRKDHLFTRKLPSKVANMLIARITGVKLRDYGCSLKAYKRFIIKNMDLYGEMHRFIPAHAMSIGAKIVEVPVNHRPRTLGQTKYNLTRTIRVILDTLTVKFLMQFSTRPMHMIGFPGLICLALGSIIAAYLTYWKIFQGGALTERPLLLLGVLLIVVGIQFMTMGLIAEMLVRIYHGGTRKEPYLIKDEIIDGKFISHV